MKGVRIAPANPGFSQKVTGTVTNAGPRPAKVSSVMVALYGSGHRLLFVADAGYLYPYPPAHVVPAHRVAPFLASVDGFTRKPESMVVYVRASTKGANGFYFD